MPKEQTPERWTGYCGSAIGALRFGDKDMVARSRKEHDKLTSELDPALAKLEALPFARRGRP